jgi:hypothetical protein
MANDDESVDSNHAVSVNGGATGGRAAPAKAPEQWYENPMYGNFNPGTSHGREIFFKKRKGLADDKEFKVLTKDSGAICKYLIEKQPSLRKVVTRIPVAYDDTGRPIEFSNWIQQYQSVPIDTVYTWVSMTAP